MEESRRDTVRTCCFLVSREIIIFFISSGVVGDRKNEFRQGLSRNSLKDFVVGGSFSLIFSAIWVKYSLNDFAINFLSEVRWPSTSKVTFVFLSFDLDQIRLFILDQWRFRIYRTNLYIVLLHVFL